MFLYKYFLDDKETFEDDIISNYLRMKKKNLNILLINDDGIDSEGIQTLAATLKADDHHVTVVAPDGDASGSSASIALLAVIIVRENNVVKKFACSNHHGQYRVSRLESCLDGGICRVPATPIECILVAAQILKETPDLIVSGMNDQHNTGAATQFSGTVGGAMGATTKLSPFGPVPAIAMSIENVFIEDPNNSSIIFEQNFQEAADFVAKVIRKLRGNKCSCYHGPLLPQGLFLNINYPALPKELIKGVKLRNQGDTWLWRTVDAEGIAKIQGLQGGSVFLGGDDAEQQYLSIPTFTDQVETVKDADSTALVNGYITIVPCRASYTGTECDFKFVDKKLSHLLK